MHAANALALAALVLIPFATPVPFAPRAAPAGDETELAQQMEVVESAVGRLRRNLRDPAKNADSLQLVVEAQTAALFCKGQTPSMAANVPEAEREAFVAAYRKEMATLLRGMIDLELALLDGDNEAAKTALQSVRDMEEPAHERFTEDG
jgi:soluble cytochrome b562